jgi:hypothetical protein
MELKRREQHTIGVPSLPDRILRRFVYSVTARCKLPRRRLSCAGLFVGKRGMAELSRHGLDGIRSVVNDGLGYRESGKLFACVVDVRNRFCNYAMS